MSPTDLNGNKIDIAAKLNSGPNVLNYISCLGKIMKNEGSTHWFVYTEYLLGINRLRCLDLINRMKKNYVFFGEMSPLTFVMWEN